MRPPHETNVHARRKTILLAEDDKSMRELIGLHLLGAGYAVRSVADGKEALRACARTVPDLVISDVNMPGMSGFEFVASLRSEAKTKDVLVIFLTVDASSDARGTELGAAAILAKPILAEKLLAVVMKCIGPGLK